MASYLKKIFKTDGDAAYPIAVVQYERDGYGIGTEEQLHWALVVLTGPGMAGPAFQIFDRTYNDGRVVWNFFDGVLQLGIATKCLGGVCIGIVKQSELDEFRKVVAANRPAVKFVGWNCRDWVMETIRLVREKGWVHTDIADQETLLPSLKMASKATKAAYDQSRDASPVVIELEKTTHA
ncbi:hypothetical protein EWM64_g6891 [Hericium alpestre]|uniref:Uncharacterized protein n=1 Tax=Hericium alpestre TaxID=135208 RepID=A0A4Y9ZST5_9AGAM|nr:hypothetical protein EWM64_g6891 [Hericium alpestre]